MTALALQPIHEQAARWHARSIDRPLSADDEQRLDAWLAQDLAHRLAFADVAAAGFAFEQAAPRAALAAQPRVARRIPAWLGALAAAPLLLMLVLWGPHAWQDFRSDVHTAAGGVAQRELADGSTLKLDTDSAVALHYTDAERGVELMRGALAVDVMKNPARPFRVRAGSVEATAVGTRYAVLRGDSTVEVGVTEGRVAVRTAQGATFMVGAGERVVVDTGSGAVRSDTLPPLAYAWTRGVLSFERAPLADVLRELDRYLPERIVLRAPAAATAPVTATFPIDQPAAALDAIARAQQLEVRHVPGMVYIVQGR